MQPILMIVALYVIVFIVVMMGSRNFFSGRTIVANPGIVAAVITLFIVTAMFWSVLWGQYAWPAFFALLVLLFFIGKWLLRERPKGS